jgi:hypothetical protein
MKTKTVVFLVFLIGHAFCKAQVRLENPETYIGFSAGATGSMVNFSPTVRQTYLLGNNAGAIFRYISDKNLGVQAEILYFQRGWNETGNKFARRLDYIDIPFLSHFYVGRNFRVFFNVGPKIGILFSEKTLYNYFENSNAVQHTRAADYKFDYGFAAGLGFLLRMKKQVFQIEARGNYSMSDIYSNEKRDYFDFSNNINATVNFSWLLQLKR